MDKRMNADKLRKLKQKHYWLTSKRISELLEVSLPTVNSWLIHKDSPCYRGMSDKWLNELKSKIKGVKQ